MELSILGNRSGSASVGTRPLPVPALGLREEGAINVTYQDGSKETVNGGDLFFWPAGHTVAVSQDAEVILFSQQKEHCAVVDHIKKQLVG